MFKLRSKKKRDATKFKTKTKKKEMTIMKRTVKMKMIVKSLATIKMNTTVNHATQKLLLRNVAARRLFFWLITTPST